MEPIWEEDKEEEIVISASAFDAFFDYIITATIQVCSEKAESFGQDGIAIAQAIREIDDIEFDLEYPGVH